VQNIEARNQIELGAGFDGTIRQTSQAITLDFYYAVSGIGNPRVNTQNYLGHR
jgi:hypothetical protein